MHLSPTKVHSTKPEPRHGGRDERAAHDRMHIQTDARRKDTRTKGTKEEKKKKRESTEPRTQKKRTRSHLHHLHDVVDVVGGAGVAGGRDDVERGEVVEEELGELGREVL